MSTGLFLAVDQIKARLSALEAEVKPGTSDTSVIDQITALQKSVADLEDEVGAPDAVAATPATPAAAQ